MNKSIAIVAGEPNSISSEIIFKTWKLKKKYRFKKFFVIGSFNLLNQQKSKLKYKIRIKKINKNFDLKDLNGPELPVLDIVYKQKKPFEKISSKSSRYIFKCFETALSLYKKNKICGFVNCPVAKETLFKGKEHGVTEFLADKTNEKNNEVMLIYNKNLSVSPITTHIPLSDVSKKINEKLIIKKVSIINSFYKKYFKKKPKIAILGLNPHNYSPKSKSKEEKIILKAVKKLTKLNINVDGPIPADSSFLIYKKFKFNVIVGMYHDQVLTPYKALFNFNAINVTLGLSFIRTSPDHGTAQNIVGKLKANPQSLIESIKFFNFVN